MPKPPVAPKDSAPRSEHQKHAQDVLAYEPYKVKPVHLPTNDDVSAFKDNDKKP